MAVSNLPIYQQTIKNAIVQILPADTTTVKTLYTGGTNGSKIEALTVSNTDSGAAYAIQVFVTISATNYLLGTVNVPLSSGNTIAAPTVDLLAGITGVRLDANGNRFFYLANGSTFSIASLTTVTTAKAVTFVAQIGDY